MLFNQSIKITSKVDYWSMLVAIWENKSILLDIKVWSKFAKLELY